MKWLKKFRRQKQAAQEKSPPQPSPKHLSRQDEQMRRFKTEIIGDLADPKLQTVRLILSWLVILMIAAISWFMASFIIGPLIIILVAFILGIRRVPTVHCALLYNMGRRTRIGFWEGFVWVPWMTGGQLKIFNVEWFSYDVPREDAWSTDRMHIVYDIVIQFGVMPVAEKSVLDNFFWFFHVLLETETYELYAESEEDLGEGLFWFVMNTDVENVLIRIIAAAKKAGRRVLRSKGFADIFRFEQDGTAVADPEKTTKVEQEIEDLMHEVLQDDLRKIGMRVNAFELADIDFDAEASRVLQLEQLARIQANAQKISYETLQEIGKKLSLDSEAAEYTLRTEVLRALQTAAGQGLLGALIQGTTLAKWVGVPPVIPTTETTQTAS